MENAKRKIPRNDQKAFKEILEELAKDKQAFIYKYLFSKKKNTTRSNSQTATNIPKNYVTTT